MAPIDPVRLSKTMAYLLRHRPEHGNLRPDDDGWVPVERLCAAVARLLRVDVPVDEVRWVVEAAEIRRFEIEGSRIRAASPKKRSNIPDILYHAIHESLLPDAKAAGRLTGTEGRPLFLSPSEAQAWRVAHRMEDGGGTVLVVDASRARRHGARFVKNRRNALYVAEHINLRDVLNLQPNYGVQLSAGGIPLALGPRGEWRLALVRVTRRSGVTWEVAKGKLEPGESPEHTAIREVQEEMGLAVPLDVVHDLGSVRYGFVAPGGLPRLKTIFLYFLRPLASPDHFTPAEREGIGAVRWFDVDSAARAVRHGSLVPVLRHARDLLIDGVVSREGLPTVTTHLAELDVPPG